MSKTTDRATLYEALREQGFPIEQLPPWSSEALKDISNMLFDAETKELPEPLAEGLYAIHLLGENECRELRSQVKEHLFPTVINESTGAEIVINTKIKQAKNVFSPETWMERGWGDGRMPFGTNLPESTLRQKTGLRSSETAAEIWKELGKPSSNDSILTWRAADIIAGVGGAARGLFEQCIDLNYTKVVINGTDLNDQRATRYIAAFAVKEWVNNHLATFVSLTLLCAKVAGNVPLDGFRFDVMSGSGAPIDIAAKAFRVERATEIVRDRTSSGRSGFLAAYEAVVKLSSASGGNRFLIISCLSDTGDTGIGRIEAGDEPNDAADTDEPAAQPTTPQRVKKSPAAKGAAPAPTKKPKGD